MNKQKEDSLRQCIAYCIENNDVNNATQKIIDYIKDESEQYTHTFKVNLNSDKFKEECNKQIEQINNATCKAYLFDGINYIEIKS
jgi:hypothetical protein